MRSVNDIRYYIQYYIFKTIVILNELAVAENFEDS